MREFGTYRSVKEHRTTKPLDNYSLVYAYNFKKVWDVANSSVLLMLAQEI